MAGALLWCKEDLLEWQLETARVNPSPGGCVQECWLLTADRDLLMACFDCGTKKEGRR